MTAIAGLAVDGDVWIGGDAAGVGESNDLYLHTDPKVFRRGPVLVGFTTSWRMGQLIRHRLDVPPTRQAYAGEIESERWVMELIEAIRTTFREAGWLYKRDEREHGGTFVVGFRGELWTIGGDFSYTRHADGIAAAGSAQDVIRGALYATRDSNLTASDRVAVALNAAQEFNTGVRGPFLIMRSDTTSAGGGGQHRS